MRVLTGSIKDQFGNETAQTSDTSGPHPDFDGSFFASTAQNRKQDQQSDCPDASDGKFGRHGLLRFRLFVLVDHVLAAWAVFAYVFIWRR